MCVNAWWGLAHTSWSRTYYFIRSEYFECCERSEHKFAIKITLDAPRDLLIRENNAAKLSWVESRRGEATHIRRPREVCILHPFYSPLSLFSSPPFFTQSIHSLHIVMCYDCLFDFGCVLFAFAAHCLIVPFVWHLLHSSALIKVPYWLMWISRSHQAPQLHGAGAALFISLRAGKTLRHSNALPSMNN